MSISLQNVEFSYKRAPTKQRRPETNNTETDPTIHISEWHVGKGEHTFIQGPSGGGKSTLLNLIAGVLTPHCGEVTVLEQRLDSMSQRKRDRFRAEHIGYVFQQFNLVPYLSAIENVQLATQFARQKHAQTKHTIPTLLDQLNISTSDQIKRCDELSIGQQQRVAIARAFINAPAILLADEPTSSLDPENRDKFMTLLMALAQEHKTTVVFVSHDLSLAPYFPRVDTLSTINSAA